MANLEELLEVEVMSATEVVDGIQTLRVEFDDGTILEIEHAVGEFSGQEFSQGDEVVLSRLELPDGEVLYNAVDHVRWPSLLMVFLSFVAAVIVVNRKKGLFSLLAMGFTFLILFVLVLPMILGGANPVLTALLGSAIIMPVSYYLSHGVSKKTHVAVLGTLASLVLTGVLASVFSEVSHLTGLASEEAAFLFSGGRESIDFQGLTLAGIIIALMGVLDDVCITQSSVVSQLKKANPKMSKRELFKRGMAVGMDHISSVVNTLIMVYAGASLPLLLLFMDGGQSWTQVLNYEVVAEEVLRTLVGSMGLVLAVPITTWLASGVMKSSDKDTGHSGCAHI